MTERWILARGARLTWRSWNGEAETVIYDDASGDTHLLDPLAAETLSALVERPTDVADLAKRIAALAGAPADTLVETVATALRDLHARGLIEPAA